MLDDLRSLVEPTTRGDPDKPLLWTAKSLRNLASGLQALGHRISFNSVRTLLGGLGYSLQANRKTREGSNHADRDAQFTHINEQVKAALAVGEPAISVDTKKKELVGDFKNGGREGRPKGKPEEVRVHDFLITDKGRAVPYGIYDIGQNTGWVSVGVDHDTASFAVNAIRRWWQLMGSRRYPAAEHLTITADAGGSNGAGCGCGRWNCKSSPTNSISPSPSATCRPVRASGTRSNTVSSPSSPRTGVASRSSVTK